MANKFWFLVIFVFITLFFPENAFAVYSPFNVTNNKFGIHITDESDIEKAQQLVNSSGGNWGYVTFVIRSDERDKNRWQNFFDELRRKKLIPIVRIASKQGNNGWEKLNPDEIDGWVGFLNSLNWVVKNRYVIIGNEINLGKEWGGNANPVEYTDYLNKITNKLKSESDDYFVMAGGLDSNAKNNASDIDEADYLNQMLDHNPDIFNKMDGLASHSYPYKKLGSGSDKGTLKNYECELNLLKNLGLKKDLPIFITETGWMRGSGNLDTTTISNEVAFSLTNIWNDPKIAAVTPFVLSYKHSPFDIFSWVTNDGKPYTYFEVYRKHKKVEGSPIQVQSGEVLSYVLPRFIKTKFGNTYGIMYIKNTGQNIWKGNHPIKLNLNGKETTVKPVTILSDVEPGHKTLAVYSVI